MTAPAATPNVSPSQTVGPFFSDCLLREDMRCHNVLVTPETKGTPIRITGRVYDGDRQPVPDAMLEIWQANAAGHYNHPADHEDSPDPSFRGWGRSGTLADGSFSFETVKPGRVPFDENTSQAPHICVAVFARGLLNHLFTRIYFEDEPSNADDPILNFVPEERRATLVARRADGQPGEPVTYVFDVVLQGQGETAFFNI
jgi:protocatechuate 3,4-dioxygenase, alpha subunit